MRFLITGTAGFIGFHVARRLLDEGHFVDGFDGMTSYYDLRLKEARQAILLRSNGYRFTQALLEDAGALARLGEEGQPDVILHLAAQAGVRYSLENPRAYVDSNLIGSWAVLELARAVRPRHLLLASTSSIYGANEKIPFAEADRADEPLTLYAASKKAMEAMAHLYGVPTTAFRFFTVYGPWGRPDMAPLKFVEAISRDEPIDVYGNGQMERDFTFIDDLVESIVRLIDVPPDPQNRVAAPGVTDTLSAVAPFRVVNIGGGQPVGLLAFIEAIENALGRKAVRRMLPMQTGDVPRTFASPALLEALTQYKPRTDVDTGARALVEWYRTYAGAQPT